jgi:hypothetical protein
MPKWLSTALRHGLFAVVALVPFCLALIGVTGFGLAWGLVIVLVLAAGVRWLGGLLYVVSDGQSGGLVIPGWLLLALGLVVGIGWRWIASGSPL